MLSRFKSRPITGLALLCVASLSLFSLIWQSSYVAFLSPNESLSLNLRIAASASVPPVSRNVVDILTLPQDVFGSCPLSAVIPSSIDRLGGRNASRSEPYEFDTNYRMLGPSVASDEREYSIEKFCKSVRFGLELPYPMFSSHVCRVLSYLVYKHGAVKACGVVIDDATQSLMCGRRIDSNTIDKKRKFDPYTRSAPQTFFFWNKALASFCNYSPKKMVDGSTVFPYNDYAAGIEKGGTFYLVMSFAHQFLIRVAPKIKKPFVIVSGSSILTAPYTATGVNKPSVVQLINTLINNPLFYGWFGQNLDLIHPKFVPIPLGVDFHTYASLRFNPKTVAGSPVSVAYQDQSLLNILCDSNDLTTRNATVLLQYKANGRPLRGNLTNVMNHTDMGVFLPVPMARETLWNAYDSMFFVASPPGFGKDCHRTYETLSLGSAALHYYDNELAIVLRELPVVMVSNWSYISHQNLSLWKSEVIDEWNDYEFERVRLDYYKNIISLTLKEGNPSRFYRLGMENGQQTGFLRLFPSTRPIDGHHDPEGIDLFADIEGPLFLGANVSEE